MQGSSLANKRMPSDIHSPAYIMKYWSRRGPPSPGALGRKGLGRDDWTLPRRFILFSPYQQGPIDSARLALYYTGLLLGRTGCFLRRERQVYVIPTGG